MPTKKFTELAPLAAPDDADVIAVEDVSVPATKKTGIAELRPVLVTAASVAAAGAVMNTRQVIAGAGLTGGGALDVDRTLNIGAHADGSIVVAADAVQVGALATDAQHGVRGGGTQHAVATGAAAGFMSAADKSKLDGLSASFGRESAYLVNEGTALSTTSPAQQTSLSWTTPALVGGTYRIGWYTRVGAIDDTGGGAGLGYAWSSLYLDGAQSESIYSDCAQYHPTQAYFAVFSGHMDVVLAAGTHTLVLYLASTAGATVYHLNRRFYIYRIG